MSEDWLKAITTLYPLITEEVNFADVDVDTRKAINSFIAELQPIQSYKESIDKVGMYEVRCHTYVLEWLNKEHADSIWYPVMMGSTNSIVTVPKELLDIMLLKFK